MEQTVKIALEKQNPWWFGRNFDTGIERLSSYPSILKYLKAPEILLLVGARRTGKSTLLYQVIRFLMQKESPESILFINMDEPIFQSRADDPAFLNGLIDEYLTENNRIKKLHLFIDEIQNYGYWVQSMKSISDTQKNIKIILTGSSSTLLKSAAATKLSGRCFHIRVYPLSFKEYLRFNNINKSTITEKKNLLERYIRFGAFPRIVLEKNETIKQDILNNYFQTIYLKDIIYPHRLRNNKDVFELLYFLISNVGKYLSYSNIAKVLGISIDTVKEYMQYAEESYLISGMNKFDNSLKKQIANPKKVYCIDTGMVNSVSFRFSENKGRLLENLAFTHLMRKDCELYYHKEYHECDFLVRENSKINQAIQVTASLEEEKTRKREIKGLLEAMERYGLNEGLILTEKDNEEMAMGGKKIIVKPFYEWLLE